ncbi:MAG: hypothetical protein ACI9R8_001667, partial [Candidatus Paceibacteria bacterium]
HHSRVPDCYVSSPADTYDLWLFCEGRLLRCVGILVKARSCVYWMCTRQGNNQQDNHGVAI